MNHERITLKSAPEIVLPITSNTREFWDALAAQLGEPEALERQGWLPEIDAWGKEYATGPRD